MPAKKKSLTSSETRSQKTDKNQVNVKTKPKYSLEDLSSLPLFYFSDINYKGDKIAFYWDKSGRHQLYVMDLLSDEIVQLTTGDIVPRALRSGFGWHHNDNEIIFGKDKDGDENHNLYSINITTKEVTQLTFTEKAKNYTLKTSKDGKSLLMVSTQGSDNQMNVFKLEFATKKCIQLTHYAHEAPVFSAYWVLNDEYIVYMYNDTDNLNNIDIWIMKSDGTDQKKLLSTGIGTKDFCVDVSPNGKTLLFNSDINGLIRPGLYFIETKEIKWLGEGKYEETGVCFSLTGNKVATHLNKEAKTTPIVYSLPKCDAALIQLPDGLNFPVGIVKNDTELIVVTNTPLSPKAMIQYNLVNKTFRTLIPADYGKVPAEYFNNAEYITYQSSDGLNIGAILYKPAKLKKGVKLPALIDVHGGPAAQNLMNFDNLAQYLSNEGYVLLSPNFRGSTGYGKDFEEKNRYDWGGGDLEDVIAGANYLKNLPYIDPNRIGIFGGSYGGYMTFMALTKKPEVFKCGFAWIGITDLQAMYKESTPLFQYFLRQNMGDPEKNAKLWRDRSAITFIHQLKTPILIIHGVNDPRCPISQSRMFRDKMLTLGKKEGVDFEYLEFADEGHGGYSDQKMRLRTFNYLVDFFNRRL